MVKKASKSRSAERTSGSSVAIKLLIACVIGAAILIALLFLAASICLWRDLSGWILPVCAYVCCAVSAFVAGFLAARAVRKSGLLCGMIAGLSLCLLLLILCLAFYGKVGTGFWIGALLSLVSGSLGGITALNLRHRRRY